MRYVNTHEIKKRCKELTDAQVGNEFLIAIGAKVDAEVEVIIQKSCAWYTNKKRITEMVSK